MKLYLKTFKTFTAISICILIISLLVFKFYKESLGCFLLGIFASTVIIAIQSYMSGGVEESKLLIGNLKGIYNIAFDFYVFNSFSVEYFAVKFEEQYKQYKSKLDRIFNLNMELGNNMYLNSKTKKQLKDINEKLTKLQLDLHTIFAEFDKQSLKMKIIYFMEFYRIIREFNFEGFRGKVFELGYNIDAYEFCAHTYTEEISNKIKKMEYNTSLPVYNKHIEQCHITEYKALKNEFEKYS